MRDFINYCCAALKVKRPKFYFKNCNAALNGSYKLDTKTIIINKKCSNILEAIAHELVHHWQLETGTLKSHKGKLYWKKKKIMPETEFYKLDFYSYWNTPHEIQARDKAKQLLKNYEILQHKN